MTAAGIGTFGHLGDLSAATRDGGAIHSAGATHCEGATRVEVPCSAGTLTAAGGGGAGAGAGAAGGSGAARASGASGASGAAGAAEAAGAAGAAGGSGPGGVGETGRGKNSVIVVVKEEKECRDGIVGSDDVGGSGLLITARGSSGSGLCLLPKNWTRPRATDMRTKIAKNTTATIISNIVKIVK